MADIELVVKLNEDDYDWIKRVSEGNTCYPCTLRVYKAIANSTPLPKGHGRLIDADDMLGELTAIDDGMNMDIFTNEVREIINEMPAIIEADKGEKE